MQHHCKGLARGRFMLMTDKEPLHCWQGAVDQPIANSASRPHQRGRAPAVGPSCHDGGVPASARQGPHQHEAIHRECALLSLSQKEGIQRGSAPAQWPSPSLSLLRLCPCVGRRQARSVPGTLARAAFKFGGPHSPPPPPSRSHMPMPESRLTRSGRGQPRYAHLPRA